MKLIPGSGSFRHGKESELSRTGRINKANSIENEK